MTTSIPINIGTDDPNVVLRFPGLDLTGSHLRLRVAGAGREHVYETGSGLTLEVKDGASTVTWTRTLFDAELFGAVGVYDLFRESTSGRTSKLAAGKIVFAGRGQLAGPASGALQVPGLQGPMGELEQRESLVDLSASRVSSKVSTIFVGGRRQAGDGGCATYVRAPGPPGHAMSLQDRDGGWWVYGERELYGLQAGIRYTGGDEREPLIAAMDAAAAMGIPLVLEQLVGYAGGALVRTARDRIIGRGGGVAKLAGGTWYVRGAGSIYDGVEVDGGGASGALIFVQAPHAIVRHCHVYNGKSHGISIDGNLYDAAGIEISSNRIHNVDGVGISTQSARRWCKILSNTIYDIGLEGITIDGRAAGEGVHDNSRTIVSGNNINNVCLIGGVGGIGLDAANRDVVTGNTVTQVKDRPGVTAQCNTGDVVNCVIAHNVISDVTWGVRLNNNASGYRGRGNIIGPNAISNASAGRYYVADAGTAANIITDANPADGDLYLGPGGPAQAVMRLSSDAGAAVRLRVRQIGSDITLVAEASASDASVNVESQGAGAINLRAGRATQVRITAVADAVNFARVSGATDGGAVRLDADGASANVPLNLAAKGMAGLSLYAGGDRQVRIGPVAGAVNYLQLAGGASGGGVSVSAIGADDDVAMSVGARGSGPLNLSGGLVNLTAAGRITLSPGGGTAVRVLPVVEAVNYIDITPGLAGERPIIQVAGGDANRNLALRGKGTGGVDLVDGGGATKLATSSTGVGFQGAAPIARPSIYGSRAGNAALADLLTKLAAYGLITDGTAA